MLRKRPLAEANRLSKLWQEWGPASYPIDLEGLVREIINRSSDGDELRLEEDCFDSIDGALVGSGSRWIATININIVHAGRRNFTLAHEIGHFCCHRKLQQQFDCTADMIENSFRDGLEGKANSFASQLLMPPNMVRPIVDDSKFRTDTLTEIVDTFGVSLSAAGLKAAQITARKVAFILARDGFVC